MELMATIKALAYFNQPTNISLYTDSKYVKDGIESWIIKWKNNNWKTSTKKPVKNKDLWIKLHNILSKDLIDKIKVFSGNLTSLPQKLHKLNYLKKIISLAGQRARLYAQAVKGSSNYNLYETALRNERILDDLYGSAGTVTLDNVYEKVTDHSNEFERNIPFDKLSKKTCLLYTSDAADE